MAQVKLLKIDTDGVPVEFGAADDVTLASFTVTGGPVISVSGIAMSNKDITGVNLLSFTDPTADGITQTAGLLVIDNVMAKERENTMTTAGGVAFPVITDVAGAVDAFRLPALAGAPTAAPTNAGEGHLVWDSTNDKMYAWGGAAWIDTTIALTANNVEDTFVASAAIGARDVVYIDAADGVNKASASAAASAQAVGFATAAALITAAVTVRKMGRLSGFTGLTPGAKQYLSATAGARTETIPAGVGNSIVQLGFAKNATTLEIAIQSLGRRA